MSGLSILIPARNEEYLQKTIEDIFEHSEADTEVIVGLDGYRDTSVIDFANLEMVRVGFIPKVGEFDASGITKYVHKEYKKLVVFQFDKNYGQRALTNRLARFSNAKYLMKCDAHVSFARGFDRVLLSVMDERTVMTPMLCRLDAEQWNIIAQPFTKKYYFDTNLVFQYGKAEDEKDSWRLVETMALQGSCFVVSREKYWEWNLCDETWGSWGFQGVETACKAWFNGGRVITNTDTFYGHLFRGVGQNVEEIPYVRTKDEIEHTRNCARELLKHPKMEWLIGKFGFPVDWTPEKVKILCKS